MLLNIREDLIVIVFVIVIVFINKLCVCFVYLDKIR